MKGKRLLCVALALALCAGLLPVGALAADSVCTVTVGETTTGYATFAAAIEAVNSAGGGTITLNQGVSCNETTLTASNATIDLNECFLSLASGNMNIDTGAKLIITDSSEKGGGQVKGGGSITMHNSANESTPGGILEFDLSTPCATTIIFQDVKVDGYADGTNPGTLHITKNAEGVEFLEIIKNFYGIITTVDGLVLMKKGTDTVNYVQIPANLLDASRTEGDKGWKNVKCISVPTVTLTDDKGSTALTYQYGKPTGTLTVGVTKPPAGATNWTYELKVYPGYATSSSSDAKSIALTGTETGASLDMSTSEVLQTLVASKGNVDDYVYKCECVVTYTLSDGTTCSVTTAPITITVEKRVVKLGAEPKPGVTISKIYDGTDSISGDVDAWVSENLLIYAADADTNARIDELSFDNGTISWHGSLTFDSKNVKDAKTLTIAGLAFNSSTALNYAFADDETGTKSVPATITPIIATPDNVGDFNLPIKGTGSGSKLETIQYTGEELKPETTGFSYLGITGTTVFLVEGTDYEVVYENNVEPGLATARVVVDGMSGNLVIEDGASITNNFIITKNEMDLRPKSYTVEAGSAPPVLELEFPELSEEASRARLDDYEPKLELTDASGRVVSLADAVKTAGVYTITWLYTTEETDKIGGEAIVVIAWPTGTLTVTPSSAPGGGYTPPYDDGDDDYTPPVVQPETGESGGWDEIQTELKETVEQLVSGDVQPGETVIVEMNGATEVPKEILQEIAGKDVNVEFDMGGGVTWTVNGQDIPQGIGDLNLGVETGGNSIPVNVINNVTGETSTVQLELSHDGPFGATLHLSVNLGNENKGYWANLYYYNEILKELVFKHACRIDAEGDASWPFDHASSYAIVIDDENHDPDWVNPFTDVDEDDWFYSAVEYVRKHDLMQGTAKTLFSPNLTTSRGMIVTILYRLDGEPDADLENIFTDVPAGSYYHDAILWANENGIAGGYGGGIFGPDDPITREQLAAMLYRYAQHRGHDVSVGEDTNILSYNDAFEISEYAIPAMQWACGEGIIGGKGGGILDPRGKATRAEAAVMLMRFLEDKE